MAQSLSVTSVPRDKGGGPSTSGPAASASFRGIADPLLCRFEILPWSLCPSMLGCSERCVVSELGRCPRCACSLCELIGRKKACEVREGTCVRLATLGERALPAPLLPATLGGPTPKPALRRWDGVCDVSDLRFDDWAVPMEDGREGGRAGSPTGPVRPGTRPLDRCVLAAGLVCAMLVASPSSEAMSVIRLDITLGAGCSETTSSWLWGSCQDSGGAWVVMSFGPPSESRKGCGRWCLTEAWPQHAGFEMGRLFG